MNHFPGEFLDYADAVNSPDRVNHQYFPTPVGWDNAPEAKGIVTFKRLGQRRVVASPPLPKGYFMTPHDSWVDLLHELYDQKHCDRYTFHELDEILSDILLLIQYLGRNPWGDITIWRDRPDYAQWGAAFDAAWERTDRLLTALFDQALPHIGANSPSVIGNRTMPPDLTEVVERMATLLESGKFSTDEVDP